MKERISKDRIIALGKDSIAKKGGNVKSQETFARRILKRFGPGRGSLIGATPTKCLSCGKPLNINSSNQVVKYCSKKCRHSARQNKRKGK